MRITILLLIAVLLAGCGEIYTIKIVNHTKATCTARINHIEHILRPGETLKKSYGQPWLFGPRDRDYRVWYSGEHVLYEFTEKGSLKDATYHIEPDCASIVVVNHSGQPVSDVYMRAQGSDDWGENLLEQPIEVDSTCVWSRPTGTFEVKIIDWMETVYVSPALVLGVDETMRLSYLGGQAALHRY